MPYRSAYSRLERARHLVRIGNGLAIDAAILEQGFRLGFLKIVGAYLGTGDLRGNGEDGNPGSVAIIEAVDQMHIAWATGPRANGQFAGKLCLRAGGKCACFLVPNMDPVDLALTPQAFGDAIEAIAHHAINAFHPSQMERLGEEVGNGHSGHWRAPGKASGFRGLSWHGPLHWMTPPRTRAVLPTPEPGDRCVARRAMRPSC